MIQEKESSPATAAKDLPGPRGGLKLGPGADRLAAFLDAAYRHGDPFLANETAESRVVVVSHPDNVKHVLQDNYTNYRQNTRKKILMGGQSLALSTGDAWRRRRRVMQPLFNQQRLAPLAPGMVAGTRRMAERWQEAAGQGQPVDVAQEMTALTLDLLIEALLGADVDRQGLRRAVNTAFEYFNDRLRNPRTLPVSVPTPRNLRLLKALSDLRRGVQRTVAEHQESGEPGDLLSLMLSARDEQTGEVMNPDQLLDEIMMLLVMGHMTTAMAATWAFHRLARHPEVEERFRAEVAEVVGDRPAEFADVAKLVYTRRMIEETMRLHPPSWSLSRVAIADDEIGGYRIPAGTLVTLSPWVTHRRPELWPDPERFDPDRFDPKRAAERPRFAYYPFGGGPRICIARDMALMELPLILATVAQRFRLRPVPGASTAPVLGIVLRPRGGLRMRLEDPASPDRPAAPKRPFATLAEPLAALAGDAPALLQKADGRYVPLPRAELRDRAKRLAGALAAQGLGPGDRLALLLPNGPDWTAFDLAALASGIVTVPIQPGIDAAASAALVRASGARTVVSGSARLPGLWERREELPDVSTWIQLDGTPAGEGVKSLRDLTAGAQPADLAALARERRPEEVATVVYTPGTSGASKAVELTHANLAAAVHALAESLPLRAGDVAFSTQPLARPAERAFHYACLLRGATVSWPGSPDSLDADLRLVKPHVLSTTPVFWKGVLNWLFQTVQANPPRRRKIFQNSVALGRAALPYRIQGTKPPGRLGWQLALADRFVFKAVRERLGGRLRFAVSTGDRIPHGWITFLWAAGFPVYETYGLAEATGVAAINSPRAVVPGSSGAPLPGVELRIADDGEILLRGETVAKTPGVDAEGWLHTGDAGFLDDAGMLAVLGRKSDLYERDGKRVSPGGLESLFGSSHFATHAVVVGAGRPYNAMLLSPDLTALKRMAQRRGIPYTTPEELVRDARVRTLFENEIQGFNDKLAPHDKVQAWTLLPRELSAAEGELTPTNTVKRAKVLENWAAEIEKLYAGKG